MQVCARQYNEVSGGFGVVRGHIALPSAQLAGTLSGQGLALDLDQPNCAASQASCSLNIYLTPLSPSSLDLAAPHRQDVWRCDWSEVLPHHIDALVHWSATKDLRHSLLPRSTPQNAYCLPSCLSRSRWQDFRRERVGRRCRSRSSVERRGDEGTPTA